MASRDIVVVGASAGGVAALETLAAGLSADLPAAVFVVLHIWPKAHSLLPQILSRSGPLPALHPRSGEAIEPGRIYIAPPDYHMVVGRATVRLDHGPTENRHRPAIDVLFRSAAKAYNSRVVGVLLSGSDDDGAAGFGAIRRGGGVTVVQDPDESTFPQMPRQALQYGLVDHTLKVAEIARFVTKLARAEVEPSTFDAAGESQPDGAAPAAYSCPECGGGMVEVKNGSLLQFRCRVGHVLSPESMLEAEEDTVERAVWAAIRALEDSAAVLRRLADTHCTATPMQPYYEERAVEREEHARVLRKVVETGRGVQAVP